MSETLVPQPPVTTNGRLRRGTSQTPWAVWLPAVVVAAAMLLPIGYLAVRAGQGGMRALEILTESSTTGLLVDTAVLVVAVTLSAAFLGTGMAFLTVRTDLPLRRVLVVLTALPLVLPTFVGAYTLVAALAPGGLIEGVLEGLGVRDPHLPSPYGMRGSWVALTLFTYPYVLLTVRAALRGLDPALEEASRTLGRSSLVTLWRVTIPQLRPSMAAGSLLVALYVLSDFGAVSLLRTSTFTRAIYLQYQAAFDRTPAAVLGLGLVLMTVLVLTAEGRVGGDRLGRTRAARATTVRQQPTIALGRWRWPAFAAVVVVLSLALVLPLAVIGWWLIRGLSAGEPLRLTFTAAVNSIKVAGLAAAFSILAGTPVAVWAARFPSRTGRLVERISYAGYALPGIVVALSLVFFGARYVGPLYQTIWMLVFAYVVLFLPQGLGATRTALQQIPTGAEDAARTLGSTPLQTLRRVVLPLASRGALSGAALVLLTSLKELPATLLLAPTGFDTLATQIWSATENAFFARAAAPALLLVLVGSVPLAFLIARER